MVTTRHLPQRTGAFFGAQGHGRVKPGPGLWFGDDELGRMFYPVLWDGEILDRDGILFNPLTGKRTGQRLPAACVGCGSFCTSPHGIHGMCGTVYDCDAKARVPIADDLFMKASCLAGVICADGSLFVGHGNCPGCVEWLGHLAFRSAGDFSLRDAPSITERLLRGKAADRTGVKSTPLDWTTYRANNSRSGSSAATVAGTARVTWTWAPNPPFDYDAELKDGLEMPSTQALSIGRPRVLRVVRRLYPLPGPQDRRGIVELPHGPGASSPRPVSGKARFTPARAMAACIASMPQTAAWFGVIAWRRSSGGSWSSAI